jgi:subtilisin family serine protease
VHHTIRRSIFATVALATAMGACAVSASADTDPAPLKPPPAGAIAGAYIVVLDDGASGASVARRNGVKPTRVYTQALDGFAARLTKDQLADVRQDSAVKYVEQDGIVKISKPTPRRGTTTTPTRRGARNGARLSTYKQPVTGKSVQTGATWGLDRVDQRARPLNGTYRYTSTGTGVTAYVIDTGIYTAHPNFGGRASGGFTSVSDGNGTNDCNGHGTHVAGTIGSATYGVAKAVRLVAVRVLDCAGSGSYSGVIAGIDWVTFNHAGPSVANMSLGGGRSQALNDAVTASIGEGVTYAVAAGNENQSACNVSPASTPLALTAGATDINDNRASFSNFGSCVDVFAPGVNITSTSRTGGTATFSGTSMASPHVAGLAALFLQNNPYATPATVASVIKTDAAAGVVGSPNGSPNLLARKWNAALTGTGASSYEPDGSYWYQGSAGYIRGFLQGTAGTDPDLFLQRWNGSAWVTVAGSSSVTPQERVNYLGSSGYYTLRVYAYSGAGTYDVWATHPS